MSLKTTALFDLAHRYVQMAKKEKDLAKAEELTLKALEWHDKFIEACTEKDQPKKTEVVT